MKYLLSAVLFFITLCILFAGFFLDPLWPAQDPTPDMQMQYLVERTRSNTLYWIGLFLMCATLLSILSTFIVHRIRKIRERLNGKSGTHVN
jgi:hypothetical protein